MTQRGWRSRPWAARAVMVVATLLPLVASMVVARVLLAALPVASGGWGKALSLAVVIAAAAVVYLVVQRGSRHLLPLAALLRMSLVFPDTLPNRFHTALRANPGRRLARDGTLKGAAALPPGATPSGLVASDLLGLLAAMTLHDRRTRGHGERTRAYSELMAVELGLDDESRGRLQWASLLHDVGKIRIPAEVLNKRDPLTTEEWELLKTHAAEGARLVEPLMGWLGDHGRAVGEHHEDWNGNGYPNGLAGEQISVAGRLVATADAFDVMTSVRSYKPSRSIAEARKELARCSGTQFDPAMVRAFLAIGTSSLRGIIGVPAVLGAVAGTITKALTNGPGSKAIGPSTAGATVAAAVALGLFALPAATPEPPVEVATATTAAPAPPAAPTTTAPPPAPGTTTSEPPVTTAAPTTTAPPATTAATAPTTSAAPTTTSTAAPTTTTVAPTTTTAPNRPPAAGARTAQVRHAGTVSIDLAGTDPDGDVVVLSRIDQPAHGTVTPEGGFVVQYTAAADFSGVDTFVYDLTDSRGATTTASMDVVVAADQPPSATRPAVLATSPGQPVVIDPAAWVDDIDGGTVTVARAPAPPFGTITAGDGGVFIYTPPLDFWGTVLFDYEVLGPALDSGSPDPASLGLEGPAVEPSGPANHLLVAQVRVEVARGPGGPEVLVSTSADRSGATAFAGGPLPATVALFVGPADDLASVAFHVDDPARARAPDRLEATAPFDLGGTRPDGLAYLFDTAGLGGGSHQLTIVATFRTGQTSAVNLVIEVEGPPPPTTTTTTTAAPPTTTTTGPTTTTTTGPTTTTTTGPTSTTGTTTTTTTTTTTVAPAPDTTRATLPTTTPTTDGPAAGRPQPGVVEPAPPTVVTVAAGPGTPPPNLAAL